MEPSSSNGGRTHYEATLEVAYGVRFAMLNRRFYDHISKAIKIATLLTATWAVWVLVDKDPKAAALFGVLSAALAVIDAIVAPGERGVAWEWQRRRYGELFAEAPALKLPELDRRLRHLQNDGPTNEIESLRKVAFADVMRDNGFEANELRPLQRLFAALA